jgi:hypothetical protein
MNRFGLCLITFLFGLLIFTAAAFADWCDVKDIKTSAVLYTYEGACDQHRFGGPWGSPAETTHVVNTTKQKQIDDAKVVEDLKKQQRDLRRARLQTFCASLSGGQRDMCDELLDK